MRKWNRPKRKRQRTKIRCKMREKKHDSEEILSEFVGCRWNRPDDRPMGGASERERQAASFPASSLQTVSSDDEIDYSVKPEFYDSELDDKDESWVTNKRKGRESDAVLSCPACFTILCYECQRHEVYVTQYRAIFVVNCKIKNSQVLPQESRKQKRQRARQSSSSNEGSSQNAESVYRQVCCDVCSTEVGVIDEDEVYHFCDVIPGEP